MRQLTQEEIRANVKQVSLQAFQAMALPLPPRELLAVMRKHADEIAARVAVFVPQMPIATVRFPVHRIRVGYVSSAAFNNHVRAHLVQLLFKYLDKQRYESFCYALAGDDGSVERQRTAAACEHFRY